MKNKNLKNIILMVIMLLLIAVTFKLIFRNQDTEQIKEILTTVDNNYIFMAICAVILYVFLAGYAIKIPMDFLGHKVSVISCFRYSLTEIYFSGITPSNTGGQPMVALAMKADGYRFADIAMVLMAVTALYKIGIMLMAVIFFVCSFSYIFQIIGYVRFLLYLGVFINIVFVGILILFMFSDNVFVIAERIVLKFLVKINVVKNPEKFRKKIYEQKVNYGQCSKFFKENPFVVLKMFIVLVMQRLALLSVTYFVYRSFGLNEASLFQIIAIQIVLSLSVEMMPLPGAVGVSESVFILLYDAVFGRLLVYPALLLTRGINFYMPFVVSTVYVICGFLKRLILNKEE